MHFFLKYILLAFLVLSPVYVQAATDSFLLDSEEDYSLSQEEQKQMLLDAYDKLVAGKYESALDDFEILTDEGNVQAMYYAGYMYENGLGYEVDYFTAFDWYMQAAELGLEDAMLKLAEFNEKGLGTFVNFENSVKWYKRAAKKSNMKALGRLGAFYMRGLGVEKDFAKAEKYLERAAYGGDFDAQEALETLKSIGDMSKASASPKNSEAEYLLDEINSFLKNYKTPKREKSFYLTVEDKVKIDTRNESFLAVIPGVKFVQNVSDEALGEKIEITVGDVYLDIRPSSFKKYDVRVILPDLCYMKSEFGEIMALANVGYQIFEMTWSTKLHRPVFLDASFSDFKISMFEPSMTLTVKRIALPLEMVNKKEEIYDVSSQISLEDIEFNYKETGINVKIAEVLAQNNLQDFDYLQYINNSEKFKKSVLELVVLAEKEADKLKERLMSYDYSSDDKETIEYPKLVPIKAFVQDTFSKLEMKDVQVLEEKKELFSLKNIAFENDLKGLKKDLSSISIALDFSNMQLMSDPLSMPVVGANVPIGVSSGNIKEGFPHEVKISFSLSKLPLNEINDAFLQVLPMLIVEGRKHDVEMELTDGMGIEEFYKDSRAKSKTPQKKMKEDKVKQALKGVWDKVYSSLKASNASVDPSSISIKAKEYDITALYNLGLSDNDLGFEGMVRLGIRGFDNLLGVKKGEKPEGMALFISPYRAKAKKRKDNRGRELEEFIITVNAYGDLKINGEKFDLLALKKKQQAKKVEKKEEVDLDLEDLGLEKEEPVPLSEDMLPPPPKF